MPRFSRTLGFTIQLDTVYGYAWHFQTHIQGWMNDLNMLLSCFREKMPPLQLHPFSMDGCAPLAEL